MQKGRVASLDIDEGAGRTRWEAEPSETRRFLGAAAFVLMRLVTCDTVTISVHPIRAYYHSRGIE